ncbi:MAG: c-type cytochrome [Candidatus Acidiferrales bacterium]
MNESVVVRGSKLVRRSAALPALAIFTLSVILVNAALGQSPPGGSDTKRKQQATVESDGNSTRGRLVYQRHCAICHHATRTTKKIARGLKGIYKAGKFADGRPVTDKSMRLWIEDGGKDMPQFKNILRPAQIADLIAYIRTI